VLVYEEQHYSDEQREPTKFYGYREKYMSQDERTQKPNFAFMIYDKRKRGFRLVPIENHVKFEKVKAATQSKSS